VDESFAGAETVMYANAIHKPRVAAAKTLAALIEGDHAGFVKKWPRLQVKMDGDLRTRDGVLAKTWRMEATATGQWERIAYIEEGEYYLVFVISSRTAAGLARSTPSFEAMVTTYAK
jgi:hypothetical protein